MKKYYYKSKSTIKKNEADQQYRSKIYLVTCNLYAVTEIIKVQYKLSTNKLKGEMLKIIKKNDKNYHIYNPRDSFHIRN